MSRLLFAGGGTGGHVFPMIAVADAVRALAPDVELVFVGTERGFETKLVPERGYELELLHVEPIRGGGLPGAARGVARASRAVFEARALARRLDPSAIFSIGGYAAGPVSIAARTLGIPVALMEPNSAIGLANRLVAPFVQRAYTAFSQSERHFRKGTVLRTGVPLRHGFRPRPYERSERPRILVVGGSQGSEALNDAVPRALARLGSRVRVTHQCGAGRDAKVRALYRELGMEDGVTVLTFIDDMPAALSASELVIGRAGANAVAEICAVGRPSVLIPYPFAGDHQRHNADDLVGSGGAIRVLSKDATPERLTAELDRLLSTPGALPKMAAAARSLGKPDAATVIARDLLELAGLRGAEASSGSAPKASETSGHLSGPRREKGAVH